MVALVETLKLDGERARDCEARTKASMLRCDTFEGNVRKKVA
jgi:hypothetical protein